MASQLNLILGSIGAFRLLVAILLLASVGKVEQYAGCASLFFSPGGITILDSPSLCTESSVDKAEKERPARPPLTVFSPNEDTNPLYCYRCDPASHDNDGYHKCDSLSRSKTLPVVFGLGYLLFAMVSLYDDSKLCSVLRRYTPYMLASLRAAIAALIVHVVNFYNKECYEDGEDYNAVIAVLVVIIMGIVAIVKIILDVLKARSKARQAHQLSMVDSAADEARENFCVRGCVWVFVYSAPAYLGLVFLWLSYNTYDRGGVFPITTAALTLALIEACASVGIIYQLRKMMRALTGSMPMDDGMDSNQMYAPLNPDGQDDSNSML